MPNFEVFNRFAEVDKYFTGTKYNYLLPKVKECVEKGDYTEAKKLLKQFPTKRSLLNTLTEKLKNKSVYRTLKKISEGKVTKNSELLKGLFSLGTHISIEIEKGNKEYEALYSLVYEKIGNVLYRS